MMVKRILITFAVFLSMSISSSTLIKAEGELEFSTDEIIVKETDLGRTYSIEITNKSDKEVFLKAEEILVERTNTGEFVKKTIEANNEGSAGSLEIFQSTLKIKPGEKIEHKVRIKFSSKNFSTDYPGINYVLYTDSSYKTVENDSYYIPFIVQSLSGEYKMDLNIDITNQDITTDTTIHVVAEVANTGSKFFSPEGSISIYKGDELIAELSVADLFPKRMYPTDNIVIEKDLSIPGEKIDSVGEYTVKFTTKNDFIEKGKTIAMTFMFVPMQILYIAGGAIGLIVIITIIISIIQKKKAVQKYNN